MMSLEDAVNLVLFAFNNAKSGDIFVQKAPAATIETLVCALKNLMNVPMHPVEYIGTRHGEKQYEVLLSREERVSAIDLGKYFRIPPDLRGLNYEKYTESGSHEISNAIEYTSDNTERLSANELIKLIQNLNFSEAF